MYTKSANRCSCWYRSNCCQLFYKKPVLENLTKLMVKHKWQSLFLIKFCRPISFKFIKKETQTQPFSCKCCKISQYTFLQNFPKSNALAVLRNRGNCHKNICVIFQFTHIWPISLFLQKTIGIDCGLIIEIFECAGFKPRTLWKSLRWVRATFLSRSLKLTFVWN